MRLHDNVLFFCQLAAFVEDFLVDAHFADIVERRCGHDDLAFMRREGIALRFADEGIQQHFRQQAEVAHVRAAFAVAGADDFADDFQHQAVAALLLVNLVAHLIAQAPLAGIELDGIADPLADDIGVERAGDVVAHA